MNQQVSTTTIAKNNASTNDTTIIATRSQSLGQKKTHEGSKTPGGQRRVQKQQKTPPEEKLKRIENDIVKRSAMQDLMYRQRQLEDAVKEARRVNLMIEEEKEKMRELKSRMLENNLTQYVTITKQEIKQKDQKSIKKSFEQFDANQVDQRKLVKGVDDAEKDSDLDSLPGLIPPIDERRKKKKNDAPALPSSANMFDDNYAFYMYYLNNSGQLVTPVEQMFQDNVEKTEQIRKLQEDLEKKSRVVKPKINSTQSPDTQNIKPGGKTTAILRKDQSSKTNHNRLGTAKSAVLVPQTPKSKGALVNQTQPSPVNKKTFLKRNPAPPAPGLTSKSVAKVNKQAKQTEIQDSSFERETSVPQQLRSQSIQGISIKPLDQYQPVQQEESQSAPPKKFTFLKRTVKNQSSPGGASQKHTSPSRNIKTHLKSMSQDLVNPFISQEIKQQTTEENIAEQAKRLQTQEDNNSSIELYKGPNSQSPVNNNSPGKSSVLKKKGIQVQSKLGLQKPSGLNQSKLKSNDLSPSGSAAAGANRSKNNETIKKEPQILIKKSSTRMNEIQDIIDRNETEQENLDHQSPKSSQGKRIPQSKLVKKGVSHSVKGSIDTSESASTLHLPPLIRPSALQQQISQTSTSQQIQKSNKLPQRPPLPTVKSSLSHHAGSALKVQTSTSSDTLMTLPSIPSSTTNKQYYQNTVIPLNDYLLQNQSSTSLTIDHQQQQQQQHQQHITRQNNDQSLASSLQSARSGRSGGGGGLGQHNTSKFINSQHLNITDEKRAEGQAKRDKQNEYYREVRASHKPKMDPRKQMEIEIRQNSVSLNQLELSARENPIKKVQLSDLLM